MKKQHLVKHTFRLEEGQVEALAALYPTLKVNEIVRRVLAAYISKAQAQLGTGQTRIKVEIDIE